MAEITSLKDYAKKEYSKVDRYLVTQIIHNYSKFYRMISRQLGKRSYLEDFEENDLGEDMFLRLLTPNKKIDLENIALKLEGILKSVQKEINKK